MKQLALIAACGATILCGGVAANAAERSDKAQIKSDALQITDFSSRDRYWRSHRHWRHGYYRPYARYGYYPRPYYGNYGYYPRRYYGGPSISFSFGGGPRYW